jgi:hypothetical protein
MMFNVLIEWHPMIGLDLHNEVCVPPAPPVPMAPHLTTATLNWIIPAAMTKKVFATFVHARVMQRGTDIQSFVPHIPLAPPAILLAPILTIFSGSKSHFGPRSVEVEGTPVAVGLLGAVNINLNCGEIPTPSGFVLAPNTVVAGMTLGDVIGGIFAMASDAAIQYAMNKILGPLGPTWSGIAGALFGSPLGFSFNANGHGAVGLVGRLLGLRSDLSRNIGETLGDTLTGADPKRAADDRKKIWDKLANEWDGTTEDPRGLHPRESEKGTDSDFDKLKQIPGNLPIVRGARGLGGLVDNPAAEQF